MYIQKVGKQNKLIFRQVSYIRQACCFTVMGHGTDGYLEAIDYLLELTGDNHES